MNLKSEGEAYWGTRMRAKWDALTEYITLDDQGDLIIGQGVLSSQAVYLNPAGLFLESVIIVAPSLPTSDPAFPNQLWNDAGTVRVSTG